MSGMALEASGSDLQAVSVFSVLPGGPAAEAGILAGDQIVTVDGAPATGPGLVSLRQSLRKEGTLTLSVLRDGKALQLTVRLRRLV